MAENRRDQRLETKLQTLVRVKESENETWKEIVDVTGVSQLGAGFDLSRPVTVGRLVALVLPMPPEFRVYDRDENAYAVMGLVQYCNESNSESGTVYRVGVAFVGKQVPESYKADPQQSYRISGMSEDGLWQITEADTQFKKRSSSRYRLALEVTISLIRKEKGSITKEITVTRDVSVTGASVVCSLEAQVGEKVKFGCNALDFHSIALVKNRKKHADERMTFHLEFVDREIAIEKIFLVEMAKQAESI
jgi:hypothetical protein